MAKCHEKNPCVAQICPGRETTKNTPPASQEPPCGAGRAQARPAAASRPFAPQHASTAAHSAEEEADRLLWAEGAPRPQDLEYPFYRETTLARLERRQQQMQPEAISVPPPSPTLDISDLLEALLRLVPLSPRERLILRLIRQGLADVAIAQVLGVSRATAGRWRRQAIARLQAFCEKAPDADRVVALREALRESETPPLYRSEIHCPAGQEACRKDGLCKYRWYLFRERSEP